MRFTILFILAAALSFPVFPEVHAQPGEGLTTGSRRARRAYERAEEAFRTHDHRAAIEDLEQAIARDADFIEAHLLMGEVYFSREDYEESITPYRRAVALDPDFFPAAKYYLGVAYYRTGGYADAVSMLERFTSMDAVSDSFKDRGRAYLAGARFAKEAKENPVPFEPHNPGPAINSEHAEYSPALTADEQTLIFTRKKPRDESMARPPYYEDFYISVFRDGEWSPAENLGPPLNTAGNEGAQTVTADGRHLYFAACNRPDGLGSCDIYYARREGDRWSIPVNPGAPLNSSAWDSQPSVSADGNTIYFTSSRPGSKGPMDIWKARRNERGNWDTPQNLGPLINTTGNELSPFIHHDNNTLYFASDGHPGMGGLDIFFSRRDSDGNWTEPQNIGYPINTHGDEFAMIVGASGQYAWFASDMEGGYGDSDLYTFELYPEARPHPHTYMRGVVVDAQTRKPLVAKFELLNLHDGEILIEATSDPVDGSFLVAIPTKKDLALNVSKERYLFFSEHFSYTGIRTEDEPYLRNISLQPIAEGHPVVLRNIFFETDSYSLRETSHAELNKLVRFMKENPGIHIEVSGHTDSTGTFDHNLELSVNRAKSVRDFLIRKEISRERISYTGHADTKPVDTNETPEGRANNRRTEFQVMKTNREAPAD